MAAPGSASSTYQDSVLACQPGRRAAYSSSGWTWMDRCSAVVEQLEQQREVAGRGGRSGTEQVGAHLRHELPEALAAMGAVRHQRASAGGCREGVVGQIGHLPRLTEGGSGGDVLRDRFAEPFQAPPAPWLRNQNGLQNEQAGHVHGCLPEPEPTGPPGMIRAVLNMTAMPGWYTPSDRIGSRASPSLRFLESHGVTMTDHPYRLPRQVVPRHYRLRMGTRPGGGHLRRVRGRHCRRGPGHGPGDAQRRRIADRRRPASCAGNDRVPAEVEYDEERQRGRAPGTRTTIDRSMGIAVPVHGDTQRPAARVLPVHLHRQRREPPGHRHHPV